MIEMTTTVAYLLFSLYCMFINFITALLGRNSQSLHFADKKPILRVEYSWDYTTSKWQSCAFWTLALFLSLWFSIMNFAVSIMNYIGGKQWIKLPLNYLFIWRLCLTMEPWQTRNCPLTHRDMPASASWVLGLIRVKGYATMPSLTFAF